MTRLASNRVNSDDNWVDAAMTGINNGFGIASYMGQREMQKAQLDNYNRIREKDELNAPVEAAERETRLLNAKLSKLDTAGKIRLMQATSIGNLVQDIETNPHNLDLKSQSEMLTGRVKELTNGEYGFSYTPLRDKDGNEIYEGTFVGANGLNKKIMFRDNRELASALTQARHATGQYTASELQQYALLEDGAKMFYSGLTDEDRKTLGVTDEKSMLSNRNFMAHAGNALRQGLSPSQYMEQLRTHDRSAQDHTMQIEKHGMDKESHAMSMRVHEANLAHANQARSEAAARFKQWQELVPLENQRAINELNRGTVQYLDTITDTMRQMYPPDIKELDELGQPTGKATYSPDLNAKIKSISKLAASANEGVNPIDAIYGAMTAYEEREAVKKNKPLEVSTVNNNDASDDSKDSKREAPKDKPVQRGYGIELDPYKAAARMHADPTIPRTPEAIARAEQEQKARADEFRRKREEEMAGIYRRGTSGFGVNVR